MNAWQLFSTGWDWEPSVVAGCAALVIGYLAVVRKHGLNRMAYFLTGVVLLLLDLVSPIDTLGDKYLFSAHIVQHFLLTLVIPPLLLLGTPRWLAKAALLQPMLNKLEHALGQPPFSWLLGVSAMLVWHVPGLFNAALGNDGLHIFQHLSFLVTGTMFWWPILGPLEERHLPMLTSVSYLFSACVCCSLLGAFLTFTPVGMYPARQLGARSRKRSAIGWSAYVGSRLRCLPLWNPLHFLAVVRSGTDSVSTPTSHAPIVVAAGVMLTLWGAAFLWVVSIVGLIVIGIGVARWRRDQRRATMKTS
jgi:putative membrane protein